MSAQLRIPGSYMRSLKSGIFQYLDETPWAVTLRELVRSGEKGFLKKFFRDIEEIYNLDGERLIRAVSKFILEEIIRTSIEKGSIKQTDLSHAGSIYFNISISSGKGGSRKTTTGTGRNLLTLNKERSIRIGKREVEIDETELKVATRVLLEYYNDYHKKKLEKTPLFFRGLYHLGTTGPATIRALDKIVGSKKIYNCLREVHLVGGKTHPALVEKTKITRVGWGGREDIYMLTPFFQIVWNTAMHEDTQRMWEEGREFRKKRIAWVKSR